MARVHKSAMVILDPDRPAFLAFPEPSAAVRQKCDETGALEGMRSGQAALRAADECADDILEEARGQAGQIIARASREAESIRKDALAKGLAQGRAEALAELEGLKARCRQAFDDRVSALEEMIEERMQGLEPEILELSLQIAEKVLGLELSRNDSAFLSLVMSAIGHFKQGEKTTLQVSKNDYWRTIVSKFSAASSLSENTAAMPEDSLADGSCVLESAAGIVDASVSAQMASIRKAMLEACGEAVR